MNHNIHNFFQRLSAELAAFLERELPPLFDDWWNKAVVNTLSFQQKRRLAQRNITSLDGLDIAGLLRVLDQNWYQISNSLNLTSEARHFVKEMQTVRNRWAHTDSKGVSVDDIYRDVDTLQRFAVVIGTEETLIWDLQETKSALLSEKAPPQPDEDHEETFQHLEKKKNEAEFEPGQIVFIKANPSNRGAVIAVLPGKPENRYKVFIDGITQTLYASQIQSEEQGEIRKKVLPCEQFHAYLTAIQIKYPGLSTLYSLNAARVDFIPYQFQTGIAFYTV